MPNWSAKIDWGRIMEQKEKRLCIFLHHFTGKYFPLYVQYYLNELSCYFDEVRMVTTTRTIECAPKFLKSNIQIQFEENEGYDFGLFYKGFQAINPSDYNQIACVNDSNILFGRLKFLFDWSRNLQVDFWGLVDSREKPWFSEHADNYHIQSHFVVFNSNAIPVLQKYLSKIDFQELKKEKDLKKLRRKIINDWEIGLTQFLISNNLSCQTFIDCYDYATKQGRQRPVNVMHKYYAKLIKGGIPMIKKRLVMDRSIKNQLGYKNHWRRLIRKYGDKNWKIEELIDELNVIEAKQNKRLLYTLYTFREKFSNWFLPKTA